MGWFPVADASFAAVLREQGADVMQPLNLDADDVVARLAIENDAMILSGDRDMLRYEDLDDKENRIKQGFAFELNNCLSRELDGIRREFYLCLLWRRIHTTDNSLSYLRR